MVLRRKLCIEQNILDLSIYQSIRTLNICTVFQKLQKMLQADMKTTKASFEDYVPKIFG